MKRVTIIYLIFIFVLIFLGPILSIWGTNEIGKPFNKWNFKAVYYARIYDSLDDTNPKEGLINIVVYRNIFRQKKELNYIYNYNLENDISFADKTCFLKEEEIVQCKSRENNKIYYIELTKKIERDEMEPNDCNKLNQFIWGC